MRQKDTIFGIHPSAFYICIVLSLGYALWRNLGIGEARDTRPLSIATYSFGQDRGKGNLIGIEPNMIPGDYSNKKRFLEKTESFLLLAQERNWLGEKTVLIFPEYYGTWLAVAEEKNAVYESESIQEGMLYLVLRHPFSFLRNFLFSKEKEPLQASIFRTKSESMREIYEDTFSYLAKKYGVTILAGSIVLPASVSDSGKIRFESETLFNTSFVFGKSGGLIGEPVRKRFLTEEEKPFLEASSSPGSVIETPAGRMGVLVCADSWYQTSYRNLREKRADFVAVPSYINRGEVPVWDQPWMGYNGEKTPEDVEPEDIGKISEGEAWRRYALLGRAKKEGFQNGINVFLQGKLWELESDGETFILEAGKESRLPTGSKAPQSVYNLWL